MAIEMPLEDRQEAERILAQIEEEIAAVDPICQWMHGILFSSRSKGRGRRRRAPTQVILIQFNGDHKAGRWRLWRGEDQTHDGLTPWDKWAAEVFDESVSLQLEMRGIHPDDFLRKRVLELLWQYRGRF